MNARRFPVPASARTALLGSAATADQLDLAATLGNPWASKVIAKENGRVLGGLLNGNPILPYGVVADSDDVVVTGLCRDGQLWNPRSGWTDHNDLLETVPLDAAEVAFIARGFLEGHTNIVLRGYTPVAILGQGGDTKTDVPEGGRVLAIVDELDRAAVLDLVVVLPGPRVQRRHDGKWQDDEQWMRVLRGVKPPPVVELDATQTASVLPQIDEATRGKPFTKEPPKKAFGQAASGYSARADDMAVEFALLAAEGDVEGVTYWWHPTGPRQYWVYGQGAAEIPVGYAGRLD